MSGVYKLRFDSQEIPVYCHMGDFGCGDGGWTPVMKIDGTKVHLLRMFYFLITRVLLTKGKFFFSLSLIIDDLPLRFPILEHQRNLQPCRREDWIR